MDLLTAIQSLDPKDPSHWTDNGAPKLSAIKALTGDETIKRSMLSKVAPGITRETIAGMQSEDWSHAEESSKQEGATEHVVEAASERPAKIEAPEPLRVEPEAAKTVDVLALPLHTVFSDYQLCRQAQDELNAQTVEMMSEKGKLQQRLDSVAAQTQVIERAIVRHERANPQLSKSADIAAYLESQRRARSERAAKARAFIEAGTTAQDVARELRGTSPLDSALKSRAQKNKGAAQPVPKHLS